MLPVHHWNKISWAIFHTKACQRKHCLHPSTVIFSLVTQLALGMGDRALGKAWGKPCSHLQWHRGSGTALCAFLLSHGILFPWHALWAEVISTVYPCYCYFNDWSPCGSKCFCGTDFILSIVQVIPAAFMTPWRAAALLFTPLTCTGFVACARTLGYPQDQAQSQGEGETVKSHNRLTPLPSDWPVPTRSCISLIYPFFSLHTKSTSGCHKK